MLVIAFSLNFLAKFYLKDTNCINKRVYYSYTED